MDTLKISNKKNNNFYVVRNKYSYSFLVIFKVLIFLFLSHKDLCVTFNYPKAFALTNENILIFHKDGIDIYNPTLTILVKHVKDFNNELSSTNELNTFAIKQFDESDNDLIFSILTNKIYIFNSIGDLIYEENDNAIISIFTGRSYDLTLEKKNGNVYSYFIAFVPGDGISIYYCQYNSQSNSNSCENKVSSSLITIENNPWGILNNAVSCEIMSHSTLNDVLVCFFNYNIYPNEFAAKYISLTDYNVTDHLENQQIMENIRVIKSTVSTDKKKSLICTVYSNSSTFCFTYSIDSDSFSEPINYGVTCKVEPYSLNIQYFGETNEFICSGIDDNGYIKAQLFNSDLSRKRDFFNVTKGYHVYGASFIYSKQLENYYIISDINTLNPKDKFISIYGEVFEIIYTTIPTTIIITTLIEEPSTILTQMPITTIISTIPIAPTTIITTVPTKIPTTIITTIPTKIPTTIITTVPTIMPTTIITTVSTIISTTIPIITTIPKIIPYICNLEKCSSCDKNSFDQRLCIECNNDKNFYRISPLINMNINPNGYIDCYNNITKPKNFYFNKETKYYEPCYKTCGTCEYRGDGNQNNCTTCDVDHMKEPENENSKNCVVNCTYYYYYSYNQYKCTTSPQCPDEKSLLIKKKRKCIDDCSKDSTYKYQYNGECIEKCPEDTEQSEAEHLCKIKNIDSCTQSSTTFELYDFLKQGGVEKIAKNYASEFNYTNKHISLLKNEVYSIMLYKEKNCISELGLPMPEIDFGECYQKVQSANGLENQELIIGIIDKKSNKKSNPITSYAFYNPENGDKLDTEEACKEDVIVVQENIKSLLNESSSDVGSIIFLAEQNIDVFNKTSEFYTSICYHFDSPCDKDVALRDRLLIYYPNITLCDSGCKNTGVNLTSMMAICECKFKEISNNDTEEEDNIYEDVVNQFNEILNQVNLAVMECYKDLFEYKYFISNTGGIIILVMILIQLVAIVIFYFSSLFVINKFIYSITENFLLYLNKSPMVDHNIIKYKYEGKGEQKDNVSNRKLNMNSPPKKANSSKSEKTDIEELNIKSNSNSKNKKGGTTKTQEGIKTNVMLNSSQFRKTKSYINKVKSYSYNNLENNELSVKSNSSSLIKKSKNKYSFGDYISTDLEDLNFHDVALMDNRLFFDYFCDKFKKKQLILQIFFDKSPLKPYTIKLLFLILDIEICFVVNAMFINEDYVSELFHSKKKEKFFSFVTRSINRFIYTVIFTIVVSYFMKCLFVEESKVKGVLKREEKNINNLKYEINFIMKEIKIKYNIFIIITIVSSLFSWFYISCFNNIYPHMKLEWIKSSFFIIILIHILSIFIILIETLLRFISFEIKSERIYKASIWLG